MNFMKIKALWTIIKEWFLDLFKKIKKAGTKTLLKYVGFGLAIVQLIISVVLLGLVIKLNFIPGIYVSLVFISLVVSSMFIATLQEWFVPGIIAKAVSLLLCIGMIIGCGYINKTIKTIDIVAGASKQIEYYDVYVLKDNSAQNLKQTDGYIFGMLTGMSEEKSEKVVKGLSDINYTKKEYITVSDLALGLKNSEVQAIIVNRAYVALITSVPGLESFESETRSIFSIEIETAVEDDDNDDNDPTLPPYVPDTPTPEPTQEPTPSPLPGTPTAIPPTATPTPTPYTGLAYTFGDITVPKDKYIYGNDNIFTCYVSGIDTYGKPSTVSRSDVNILVTVNLNTHQIMMINTPRDYYVPLSGANMRDKLTHAGIYGIKTSIKTLQMLYGVNIDYYVKVNFSGFIKIINAVGGIDIEIEKEFVAENGLHFNPGLQHLTGDYALAYARERHSFAGGDTTRGKHQMQVITAVINKMLSTDALLHFNELFDSISECVVTDMSYERISGLVKQQVETGSGWDIITYTVTGKNGKDLCYALRAVNDVCFPNQDTVNKARNMFKKIYKNQNPQ